MTASRSLVRLPSTATLLPEEAGRWDADCQTATTYIGGSGSGSHPGDSKTHQSVHIANDLASGSRCQPARGEPPVPPVDAAESCVCAPCREFAEAIDRHTEAIARGRGDDTRADLRTAACVVDAAHGLAKAMV